MTHKLVTLVLLGCVMIASCYPSVDPLEEQVKLLDRLRAASDRMRLMEAVLKAESNEDYDTAINLLTTAIQVQDDFKEKASLYASRALVYAVTLRFDQALADFGTSLRLDPIQSHVHSSRGKVYGAKGDYDRAFIEFDAAIRLDEKSPLGYRQRGEVYLKQREYGKALADFDKAIALHQAYPITTDYPIGHMSRGWTNFYMEDFPTAITDFRHALEQSKKDPEPVIWLYLARLRGGQEGMTELQENARQLNLQKWPGPVVDHFLGAAAADAIFEALKHSDPKIEKDRRCKAYFYLGQYALANNDRSEAVKFFTAALETGMTHSIEYFGAREEFERLKQ